MKLTSDQVFGLTDSHLVSAQDGYLLHEQTLRDFESLRMQAKADGLEISIASSFRNFERQLMIWNNKFSGERPVFDSDGQKILMAELDDWQKVKAILLYSAMPGASRHHWGSDLDVYDKAAINSDYQLQLEPYEYEAGGPFNPLTEWLTENMSSHGFYRPYAANLGGVAQELWHISHKQTATEFTTYFKSSPQTLLTVLDKHQIAGFSAIKTHFDYILDKYVYSVPTS